MSEPTFAGALVLDDLPLPALVTGPKGDTLHVNRALAELCGEPLLRGGFARLVHPDDRVAVARALSPEETNGDVREHELRLLTVQGHRWQCLRSRTLPGAGGGRVLHTLHDIHALKTADERDRAILDAAPTPMWTARSDGGLRFNGTWTAYTALPADLDEDAARDVVHPEDRPALCAARRRLLADARPTRVEARLRRGDGAYRWHEVTERPFGPDEWLGLATDVHDRRESEARLRLLADAGETLARGLDTDETLARLAALAVPRLADWCVVYRPRADGVLAPIAVEHRDPAKVALARHYIDAFPARIDDEAGIGRAFREGEAVFLPDLPRALADLGPLPEGWAEVLEQLRLRSFLMLPLVAQDRPLGLLGLYYAESGRVYGDEDLPIAREFANRAALALDNARLYGEARELNAALEARVRERTAELDARNRALEAFAELSREFATETDPVRLVGRAQEILVNLLPHCASTYYEPEGDRWTLRSHRGDFRSARLLETLARGLPRGASPNVDRPFDEAGPFYQERHDPNSVPAAASEVAHVRATASLPVLVGGRAHGVLIVGSFEPRTWAPEERALLETVSRSLGVALDRAAALRDVQHERVFLSGLLQSLSEGIVACNAEGHLTVFNGAAEALHGHASPPLPAETWSRTSRLYRPDGATPLAPEEWPLHRAWRGESVRDQTVVVHRADGERRVMVAVGGPIVAPGGEKLGAVIALRDVTERDRAEAALRQANRELKRSNEELEQFAYVASHDLQAPARAVTSFAGALRLRYGHALDERGHAFLGQIVRGGERMKRLVDDLLAFSRVNTQRRPLEPVDARRALDEALDLLAPDLTATGGWVTAGPLPVVLADEGQLVRVWVNLLGNALKYARPGVPPRVHVTAAREADGWRLAVRDNGLGIEARFLETIFEPFKRLHSNDDIEGSGLGLAVSRKIVERHGGRLWAESAPGEGSTFSFTLPAAEGCGPGPHPPEA